MNDYTEDIMFWARLKVFIASVETYDDAGEQEKQMIIHSCSSKLNIKNTINPKQIN